MKKLRLKALSLGAKEILSREQLRSFVGGSGSGEEPWDPHCPDQLPTQVCCRCEQNLTIMFTVDLNPPDYTVPNYSQTVSKTLTYCGPGGSSWCTPY